MNVTRQCPLKPGSQFRKDAEFQQWLGRREWIKRFALGTAATLGSNLVSPVMAEIVAGANPANIIKINLNSYPALLTDYGSVRFNLFGSTVTNGIITVTRAPGPVYYSMSAYCTHAGCIVEAYDNSPGTEAMICYCHSSVYNIQGQIITEAQFTGLQHLPGRQHAAGRDPESEPQGELDHACHRHAALPVDLPRQTRRQVSHPLHARSDNYSHGDKLFKLPGWVNRSNSLQFPLEQHCEKRVGAKCRRPRLLHGGDDHVRVCAVRLMEPGPRRDAQIASPHRRR
jgi:Rieske Fe-S protein